MPAVDDLNLLLSVVREAGDLALAMQAKGIEPRQKPDGSIVTDADLAVDELLKSRIMVARPQDGWLSEETPDTPHRLQKSRLWIADPIDGTRAFANCHDFWGTGMALVEDGCAIASAVYFPREKLMYHAAKNLGAFLNGARLPTPSENQSAPLIAPKRFHAHFAKHYQHVQGPCTYPLLLRIAAITTGQIRAAISQGQKHDWDLAAGHLILQVAGGKVSDLDGNEIIYNRPNPWQLGLIACATPAAHAQLLNLVRTT